MTEKMVVNLLVILLAILIIVMTYINSGYSVHYFHILNVIFFLTFIVSMCGLIMDSRENESKIRERYVSIILQKLYDAETDPSNPYKTVLCIETVLCLDRDALRDIDARLRRLVNDPAFRRFWQKSHDNYPDQTRRAVEQLFTS